MSHVIFSYLLISGTCSANVIKPRLLFCAGCGVALSVDEVSVGRDVVVACTAREEEECVFGLSIVTGVDDSPLLSLEEAAATDGLDE